MNYLDIYKLLRKTNCGECGQPTCMSFALSVFRGEKKTSECPYLAQESADAVMRNLVKTDWKAALIASLKEEVSRTDLSRIAGSVGGEVREGAMKLRCLGAEYTISPDGEISGRSHINPWIQILLLHYVRTAGAAPLRGEWVSFADLRGGLVKSTSFTRECEEPLRQIIDRDMNVFQRAMQFFGAQELQGEGADRSWVLFPLPKVPFRILYWKGDDEFGSAVKVLFDRTADTYLDVESLVFLGEGLVEMLKRIDTIVPAFRK
ncbi:MAG: DUF3786 domain-containing protein [bacterium]